ncbi:DUF2334 domain-containing protein [Rubrivivax gelatinosus]|uniref:Deacetylase n=1 Tax=Rubrivivax gelatinosus (strain NBRC 100245 / IL144) TaxID=983917 RepID=I0HS33_RUBGI|nr:DUF2334 domain-containing protein [Rubrivivax gelatinosus]MBG6082348.1 putative deacetylase [Rubrivivax gelatinosus]BAL95820.1 hypothetical protein RGE_24790 [Rubrivivax gelatinosus IL144]
MRLTARGPRRHVAVVMHDVADSRWAGCARVLAQAQRVARECDVVLPLTLLVVPRMHGQPASAEFLHWLRRQAQAGHELALHGYTHLDDGPAAAGPLEHWRRHWYTAGEGEFAALGREQAAERLQLGLQWAEREGLPMAGFVAPAWLLGDGGWDAVRAGPFAYTCTLGRVVALPGGEALAAPSFVFSTRAAWRVHASVAWNRLLGLTQRQRPLQRFELHPADCDAGAVSRCWSDLLRSALRSRHPVTLGQAAAIARRLGTRPATAAG